MLHKKLSWLRRYDDCFCCEESERVYDFLALAMKERLGQGQ